MVEVIGVREQDDSFNKMMAVKVACDNIGSQYPDVIHTYFGDDIYESAEYIRDNIQTLPLLSFDNTIIESATTIPYERVYDDTFEIKLSDIPKDVNVLRIRYSF